MWQSPVVSAAPAAEPISVDDAKEFLRLDASDTAFDGEVAIHVAGAREWIERATSTRLITQTLAIGASGFADLARLPIGPVQAITGVTYVDQAGDEQTLAAEDFELFGAELEWGIRPAFGSVWPVPANRAGAVTVTATVGYGATGEAMPPAVKVALLLVTRALFDDRGIDVDHWLVNHRIWL